MYLGEPGGCKLFQFKSERKKMGKKIVLFLSFCTLLASCNIPAENFKLRDGDLLFSVGKGESELLKAIQNATSKGGEIPFSHVGIAYIENDSVFVLEAAPKQGVVKTPLPDFIDESAKIDFEPIIAVGRVKKAHEKSAKEAPQRALMHIGKKYDFAYSESNDDFYCSELVRFSFLDSNGKPIFPAQPMSFKNKETGLEEPFWVDHFKKLNQEIPEGEPGTNPADMAKSDLIEIVYRYY